MKWTRLFLATGLILGLGCRGNDGIVEPEGQVGKITLTIPQAPAEITQVVATLSRPTFANLTMTLAVVDSALGASGSFADVPVGTWHLVVEALDAASVARFRGESDVEVFGGQTSDVDLLLLPTGGAINIRVRWGVPAPPVFVTAWDVCSSGGRPYGVAVDSGGAVYVTNQSAGTLEKYTRDGAFVSRIAESLDYPCGVAVASNGTIYVVEHLGQRIARLSATGDALGTFGGLLQYPVGIALDPSGNVFVTDSSGNHVHKYTAAGDSLVTWGESGNGPGQLNQPYGVVVGPNGFVYVSEYGNNRIQEFTADGEFVQMWGGSGSGDGSMVIPGGTAVDLAGHLYVADNGNARIDVFDAAGIFLYKWGVRGGGQGEFGSDSPTDIAVNMQHEIFVVDRDNCRIEKFAFQ